MGKEDADDEGKQESQMHGREIISHQSKHGVKMSSVTWGTTHFCRNQIIISVHQTERDCGMELQSGNEQADRALHASSGDETGLVTRPHS